MKFWLNSTLLTVFAVIAAGASPCPTVGHSNYQGDNQPYLTAGGGCNTLVTVNANSSITITIVNANPYDGSDDNLVGVVNNTSTPLTTLTLSGSGISGWDGDGICAFGAGGLAGDTFTTGSSAYCSAGQLGGTDPQDYYGPNMTFTNFGTGDAVTVNFSTAVPANGGTTFFSLEEVPSSSLVVTGGPTPTPTPTGLTGTPAPASIWLIAIGFCALGSFYFYRTRVAGR
jgi:hypothetical protein